MKVFAGLFVFGLVLVAGGSAMAQRCPASPAPCDTAVKPVALDPTPSLAAPSITPAAPVVAGKQQLPVTGGDAGVLALTGAVLVAGGATLVWRTRGANAA